MRVERSIEIAALPEKIWPFLVEPEKIMKWFTFLQKFEYTGEQRSGVGTPFYYEEKSGPQLMKLSYVVTEWVENKRFVFRLTSGSLIKRQSSIYSPKLHTDLFGLDADGHQFYGFDGLRLYRKRYTPCSLTIKGKLK